MLLSDVQIRDALKSGDLAIEPFDEKCLEPASYDIRLGRYAFSSKTKEKRDLQAADVLTIEGGEFAIVETLERVQLSRSMAGQLGLRSEYARRGLLMLSGSQIDPGWGEDEPRLLKVRFVNLAPHSIAVTYQTPFLTAQFFRLSVPTSHAYSGPHKEQAGIGGKELEELAAFEGMTIGGIIGTLSTVARDVSQLTRSVDTLGDRLDRSVGALTQSVATLVARDEEYRTSAAELRKSMTDLIQSVSSVVARDEHQRTTVTETRDALKSLDLRVQNADSRVAALTGRVDRVPAFLAILALCMAILTGVIALTR